MVSFRFKDTSIAFVNAHFAAHQGMVKARNDDYHTVVSGMHDILNKFDHLFWFGDLNYRCDYGDQGGARSPSKELHSEMCDKIANGSLQTLFETDQLTSSMRNNDIFVNFEQAVPSFRPTFKVLRDVKDCEYDPKRSPAWTDR